VRFVPAFVPNRRQANSMVLEDLEHRGEQLKQRIEMVRSYL